MIAADFDTESYRLYGNGFYNPSPHCSGIGTSTSPSLPTGSIPMRLP